MAHHVSFEAVETYLHKNVKPSDIKGDKVKIANFSKCCKPFSILHGELMHNNTMLIISSTESQHNNKRNS